MDRSYAQVFTRIWLDEDFRALGGGAQRMYLLLLSQPNLNAAGVLPTQERRWSGMCADSTREDVDRWLDELIKARFIVIDEAEEELLIRSFIRNDELWRQPNMFKSALRCAEGTLSRTLRRTLRAELERLPLSELTGKLANEVRAQAGRVIESLPEGIAEPFAEPFQEAIVDPITDPPGTGTGVGAQVQDRTSENSFEPEAEDAETEPEAEASPEPTREDVERICAHLADRVEVNGSKRPNITKRWRTAARLMLDADGRTEEQIHNAIDWCQDNEFWRDKVMAIPKLRDKYDQLRLQAKSQRDRASPREPVPTGPAVPPREEWMHRR